MKRIAIIGAGWLGLPLARRLKELRHTVFASRRSEAGILELAENGISGFICDLNMPQDLSETLSKFNIDTIVGSFPPGFRRGQGDEYISQWKELCEKSRIAGITKIIMISSSTVYPDCTDDMSEDHASLELATNNDEFSANAKRMLQAEQTVIDSGVNYVIVRCSGLIGPNRHPARFVSKLKQVSRLAPANMLHLTDAIGATVFAIEHLDHTIVNATTPATVSKAEFYQAALNAANLDDALPPIVDIADKRIVSDKLMNAGYTFHYSHTLEALKGNE
ncbi:NAD-dependent epimerase/dehydratase family protein [Vibrio ziniensis]|uniref:NAD(P)H-binding protein n=1 Tax=Vibrio ziniensis TaxID=2711221 RepID=A0A6G7CIX8_9VIBR|nr:NAD-dependent epimerase/dehydratase family protein [Vibrio ziniensis]QIH42065.1 NAD(P)H-binding protein [Vibrio ziniensis]